jgi:hypothetical protein
MGKRTKSQAGTEIDIHVWAKPQDETVVALFTLSIGKRSLCVDAPLDEAVDSLRSALEDAAEGV